MWLQVIERVVLDLAALATLAAVWVALRALRESDDTTRALNDSLAVAKADQEKRQRERAALVLPAIDLLQARLNSNWRDGLAYEVVHPTLDIIDRHVKEIDLDIGLANELSERAGRIDPKVAIYAELVWRRIRAIRLALELAQRNAPRDRALLSPEMLQRRDGEWNGYRTRILQLAAEAALLLRRMEACFPPDATTIDGMTRETFLAEASDAVVAPAQEKVETMLQELNGEDQSIRSEF